MSERLRPLLVAGDARTVECALEPPPPGTSKSDDHINLLLATDVRTYSKLVAVCTRLAESAGLMPCSFFRHLDGPIWEVKALQTRMPCFRDGAAVVLTHGFKTQTQKTPRREIDKAVAIMKNDVSW